MRIQLIKLVDDEELNAVQIVPLDHALLRQDKDGASSFLAALRAMCNDLVSARESRQPFSRFVDERNSRDDERDLTKEPRCNHRIDKQTFSEAGRGTQNDIFPPHERPIHFGLHPVKYNACISQRAGGPVKFQGYKIARAEIIGLCVGKQSDVPQESVQQRFLTDQLVPAREQPDYDLLRHRAVGSLRQHKPHRFEDAKRRIRLKRGCRDGRFDLRRGHAINPFNFLSKSASSDALLFIGSNVRTILISRGRPLFANFCKMLSNSSVIAIS